MSANLDRHVRVLSTCLVSLSLALACRAAPITGPAGDSSATVGKNPVDIGTLGGASSFANDINNAGTVVGAAENAAGLRRAFRWTPASGMTDLGTLPGHDWSEACCITDDGRILGVSGSSGGSTSDGTTVVWSPDGTITAVAIPLLPGAEFGMPTAFNARGDIIGWDFVVLQHAWIWSAARGKYDITAAAGTNEGSPSDVDGNGLVVGTSKSTTAGCRGVTACWRPFLWSDAAGYRELGAPEDDSTAVATALGMNSGPTIVGWARTNTLGSRPYVWREGEGFTILPTTAGGYATAINTSGTAVGAAWDPGLSAYYAIAWTSSGTAVRLSPDNPNPQVAVAINETGAVAGWSTDSNGRLKATVWLTGSAASALATAGAAATAAASAATLSTGAARAAAGCLAHGEAPVSRAALFACVSTAAPSLP